MVLIKEDQWSYYNATSDAFVIAARQAALLKSSYVLTLYYGSLVGASFIVFIAFIVLSTRRQRKRATFFLHGTAFFLLVTSSILVLQSTKNLRYAFFSMGDTRIHKIKSFRYFVAALVIKKIGCLVAASTLVIKMNCCLRSTSRSPWQRRSMQLTLIALLIPRVILVPILGYVVINDDVEIAWRVSVTEYCFQAVFSALVTVFFFSKAVSIFRKTSNYGYSRLARIVRLVVKTILFTFLVPLVFQIACLVRLSQTAKTFDVYPIQDFACINVFSTILIALLCTTWSPIRCREENQKGSSSIRRADHNASPNIVTSFFGTGGVVRGEGVRTRIVEKPVEAPSSVTLPSSDHQDVPSESSHHDAADLMLPHNIHIRTNLSL